VQFRSLLDPASAVWMRLASSRIVAFLFFAAVYAWPTITLARRKLLWDDEFFTLYLSKTKTWHDLLQAMATGADQHPPSFYYLTHLIFNLAGTTHLTLRLTAIVGFGAACMCLYEIVSRILNRPWGMAAMLLPLTSNLYFYASEGRGYGLEFGFVSFSVLMWMLVCEGKWRPLTTLLLAVGLCGAVGSHYYAGLVLIPLATGELVRTVVRRRVELPVWFAFGGAFIPVVAFARTILAATRYSGHFWARPHVLDFVGWYRATAGYSFLLPLAAFALVILFQIPVSALEFAIESPPRLWYGVTTLLIALLPVFGVLIALLVTHAYTERYMIAAFLGVSILLILGIRRIIGSDALGPAFVCVFCLVFFFFQWRVLKASQLEILKDVRDAAALLRRSGDLPIAMAEVTYFHRLSFYVRRDLARRLVYLADPHLSNRYLGHDTIDRGLLDLNRWFPLNVVWWYDWVNGHPSFLVYGYIGGWTWLTFELPKVSDNVQLLERPDVARVLISVQDARVPADDRTPSDPPDEPILYERLPNLEEPLCTFYMRDSCPVIDDPSAPRLPSQHR